MKIKILEGILKYDGGVAKPGEEVDLNDAAAAVMIKAGDAVAVEAKPKPIAKPEGGKP